MYGNQKEQERYSKNKFNVFLFIIINIIIYEIKLIFIINRHHAKKL